MVKESNMVQITVRIPKEYKTWLEKKVDDKDYGSINHGVQVLIRDEIKREEVRNKNE